VSWVEVSSESIGIGSTTYGIAKYPIRKQFALVKYTPCCIEPVAYFRSETEALEFADVMQLKVTDHRQGATRE
jgi:hypothetical protein